MIKILLNDYYKVIQQSVREVYIRIFLLNSQLKRIDEIQGVVLDGGINIDVNSDIRRTCSISMIVKDSSYLVGHDRRIWMDKNIEVQIGIMNYTTKEVLWFDQGTFMLNQPSISYNSITRTLSLECIDLMAKMDDTRNGQLKNTVQILENTNISTAIKSTVQSLGGFQNVLIEDINKLTPYEIEKKAGDTVYSILKELKDLYMDWEMFFDIKGTFIYQKIKNKLNDSIVLDFNDLYRPLETDISINYDFENVKNSIYVYGRTLDDGTQIVYVLKNEDPNSPFNIDKIGEIPLIVEDDKIFTVDQAEARAKYELWKHCNLNETINIQCVPIYFLKANSKIRYKNDDLGIDGDLLIQSMSIPLTFNSKMNIEAIKVY